MKGMLWKMDPYITSRGLTLTATSKMATTERHSTITVRQGELSQKNQWIITHVGSQVEIADRLHFQVVKGKCLRFEGLWYNITREEKVFYMPVTFYGDTVYPCEDLKDKNMLLGDYIEKFIMWVLPKKVYFSIHGHNCGCTNRKKWLNRKHKCVINAIQKIRSRFGI